MLLFHVKLTPTEEELFDGLKRSGIRRASNGRLIVQTIVLSLVAVWSLAAFFLDGNREWMSVLIAAAAMVLIPVMWFVPLWKMQSMAREAAESEQKMTMWVFEDGIDFAEECPEKAFYPYRAITGVRPDPQHRFQTLVIRFPNDNIVVVPRSLLSDEEWQLLVEKTS